MVACHCVLSVDQRCYQDCGINANHTVMLNVNAFNVNAAMMNAVNKHTTDSLIVHKVIAVRSYVHQTTLWDALNQSYNQ